MDGVLCSSNSVDEALAKLSSQQHLCQLYSSRREQRRVAVEFLKLGLKRDETCWYIGDVSTSKRFLVELQTDGIDVGLALDKGKLAVLSEADSHANLSSLKQQELIKRWRELTRGVGRKKLRVLRDMSTCGHIHGGNPMQQFLEFEAALRQFLQRRKVSILCQYDRQKLGPELMMKLLRTHSLLICGTEALPNPFCIRAEHVLGGDFFEGDAKWMVKSLDERARFQEVLASLSRSMLNGLDKERARIARELHETVAQHLAALKMNLAKMSRSHAFLDPSGMTAMLESTTLVSECIRQVRTLSFLLRPQQSCGEELSASLRFLTSGFQNRSGIPTKLQISANIGPVSPEVETAIVRIAQECLTNVQRHSATQTGVHVKLSRGRACLTLEIRDKSGRVPANGSRKALPRRPPEGVGTRLMRERISELGGRLNIEHNQWGRTVSATIPIGTDGSEWFEQAS